MPSLGDIKSAVHVRTGGQTGVDRAALDVAVKKGIPYGGWCPSGGWAEDLPDPPGVMAKYPHLTPSKVPEQRTAWNVRDSHATLILLMGEASEDLPGTLFTRQCAELVFLRPCLVVDATDLPEAAADAGRWLERVRLGAGLPTLVLNIAGPRASEAPGAYAAAGAFLEGLFADRQP
jgi:Circularly permutated YpsA SLOG family